MKKTSKNIRLVLSLVILGVVGAVLAWVIVANRSAQDNDKLAVVASYYPLYEFAQQVGGDKVTAVNMTPAGADSHDYEPSAREVAQAQNSAVFVYNGAGFEAWAENFLAGYHGQVVNAAQNIDLLEAGHDHEEGDHHDESEEHDHEGEHNHTGDPHFWLDPQNAQQIVNNIRDGLIAADPVNADYYTHNAANYNQQLAQLDQDFKNGLQTCQQATIVTSHNAFSYVAERYGFAIKSIAGQSHDDEPSAAELAKIANFVRANNIQFVLAEQLDGSNLTGTITQETGAQKLLLDPIEGLTDESQNYLKIQQQNLGNLRRALACN